MSDMHVLYIPATDHVIAAHMSTSAKPPTVASLAGSGGLYLGGIRRKHEKTIEPPDLDWRTPTTQDEQFWIPHHELAIRTMPVVSDVFARPHAFVVDTDRVAEIPYNPLRFRIFIDAQGKNVIVDSPKPADIKFTEDRRVWIQVEGPRPVDRRIMSRVIAANDDTSWSSPLTVEPDGPVAPIPIGDTTYYILVLVEGCIPEARTQTL